MTRAAEPQLFDNSLNHILKQIDGLISLPEIYLKFRLLINDPTSTNDDFSELISCDPNLSAIVLKVVNSALFGFPGQIDSIKRAVNLLGIGQLHDMVLGASAVSSLNLPNDIVPLKTFWRTSLFSGVLARLLAHQLNIRDHESLFIIGLLHEIGHLIMYAKYPGQTKQAIANVNNNNPLIHEVEHAILGFHYGQIGALLMAQWQLPISFQVITYYQPNPSDAPLHPLNTALIHLAHGYAHKYFHDTGLPLEQLLSPDAWKLLNLTPVQIDNVLEKAIQISAEMEKAILK